MAGEAQVRQHRLQVPEELRDGLVRLAVGRDRREVEIRMRGEQAQQFARHVAGAAEHDRGDARVHCATATAGWAARPSAAMMWSPSAAPAVIALNAARPSGPG